MEPEACLIAVALAMSLWLRPWRMLSRQALEKDGPSEPSPLVTPLLATLVVLPWLWALPTLHRMPLQLQWSGACLVVLMLGPLAIPALVAVGGIAPCFHPRSTGLTPWARLPGSQVVPATLALALGAVIRRLIGTQPFVYVLGRAFSRHGRVLVLPQTCWASGAGIRSPGVEGDLSLVARWLMAWGDAFVTGMLTAIFVAFKPEWLGHMVGSFVLAQT